MEETELNKNESAPKVYGLIGYPLGHSFSKKYFEDKFHKEDLSACAFELFPLKEIYAFKSLIENQNNLRGLAVTIPYKEAVMPFLTHISAGAKEIGAVNCIKIWGKETTGYNTDAIGFEQSLLPLLSQLHTKALVLGTGGASKAVQYILKKIGIRLLLVSRKKKGEGTIAYADISPEIMKQYSLIINCTPVGMSPEEDALPDIPYQFLTDKHLLYDLIYKPDKTKFLQEGEKYGCTIKNGLEMLFIQAEENWKIWNSGEF